MKEGATCEIASIKKRSQTRLTSDLYSGCGSLGEDPVDGGNLHGNGHHYCLGQPLHTR